MIKILMQQAEEVKDEMSIKIKPRSTNGSINLSPRKFRASLIVNDNFNNGLRIKII